MQSTSVPLSEPPPPSRPTRCTVFCGIVTTLAVWLIAAEIVRWVTAKPLWLCLVIALYGITIPYILVTWLILVKGFQSSSTNEDKVLYLSGLFAVISFPSFAVTLPLLMRVDYGEMWSSPALLSKNYFIALGLSLVVFVLMVAVLRHCFTPPRYSTLSRPLVGAPTIQIGG